MLTKLMTKAKKANAQFKDFRIDWCFKTNYRQSSQSYQSKFQHLKPPQHKRPCQKPAQRNPAWSPQDLNRISFVANASPQKTHHPRFFLITSPLRIMHVHELLFIHAAYDFKKRIIISREWENIERSCRRNYYYNRWGRGRRLCWGRSMTFQKSIFIYIDFTFINYQEIRIY